MDLTGTKILVALLFGVIRFAFGILPIQICAWLKPTQDEKTFLHKHRWVHKSLILAQCFSGGVFFATCFLYMMPAVYSGVAKLKETGALNTHYPYSQLLVSLGFFLIYFLEEFCHWLISVTPKTPFKCRFKKVEEDEKRRKTGDEVEDESELDEQDEEASTENSSERVEDFFEEQIRTKQEVVRCCLIATALSVHAIFEGVAVGLQHSTTHIWYIFTAISVHSAAQLFYVGLVIFLKGRNTKTIVVRMFLFAFNSPLGVVIGLVLSLTTDSSLGTVLLEGVSAGTILYITFIEILGKEKERRIYRRTRTVAIGCGFALMAGLVCII